jgi:DNA-binding SARP family transcriptional activator
MEFRILGPLEVREHGRPVALAGARQRAFLTLLLLHPNQPIATDRLIDDLYPDESGREATKSLQMQVSRLRRALGNGRDALETAAGGYRLIVAPDALDLSRFERHAARGRRLAADRDFAEASAAFAAAMDEWRGPALEDVAYEPFAQAEISRLEELRLTTLEEYIDVEFALGRHAEWVVQLGALTAAHPFREQLCGQLMLALYRTGRQADALETFRETRARLKDELGLEPGRRLRDLQAAILAHDPSLDWISEDASRPARPLLPRRLHDAGAFIGRRDECARLERLWGEARSASRLALIGGEPGIGKTRLAKRIAERAHGDGGVVLYGRCDEHLAIPYRAWADVLGQYVEAATDAMLAEHVSRHGRTIARLAPALTRRVAQLPDAQPARPEIEQYLLFEAVAGLLQAAAEERPLLVVLDDLHWADQPTLSLLRHVVSSGGSGLIVVTYRDSELEGGSALGAALPQLHRELDVERLTLRGLDAADVVALVQLRTGHELAQDEVAHAQELARETSGNPFFLGELLRHHVESGALQHGAAGWRLARGHHPPRVPDSLRDVITDRVHRLGASTADLLRGAAVIGIEFDLNLLADVLGRKPDELLDSLDHARRAKLVREAEDVLGRYRFEHALVSHTLAMELGPTRRARLHRRIALALEERPDTHPGELAYHWTEAGAYDDAIAQSRRAGQHALEALAPEEAARWFAHALELHRRGVDPDPGLMCDLLTELGEAQRRGADSRYRTTLLEASALAQRLRDGERLATAALANTRGFESASGQVDNDRVQLLRTALDLTEGADPLRRARLLALLALELTFAEPIEVRRELSDEAVELARVDPATHASVLWARHALLWTPELLGEHLDNAAELRELADRLNDPVVTFWAACDTVLTSVWSADLAAIDAGLSDMRSVTERVGKRHPILSWVVTWYSAWRAHLGGELEEAEMLARRAAELGKASGQPDAIVFETDELAAIRYRQGRISEMTSLLERVVSTHPGLPLFRGWLGLAYCDAGREHDAALLIEPSIRVQFTDVRLDIVWLSTLCLYAELCARLELPEPSGVLYARIAPFADQVVFNASIVLGSAHWFLARLAATRGETELADRHAASAAAVHARLGGPPALARDRTAEVSAKWR